MNVPYRPEIDFNSLSVPPNYVPGSLRGDRGFRTSIEKVVGTRIALSKQDLKLINDLSLLHDQSSRQKKLLQPLTPTVSKDESKEPVLKQQHLRLPVVYDLTQYRRLKAATRKTDYIYYTQNNENTIDSMSISVERSECNYLGEISRLETECHQNPGVVFLWNQLVNLYYKIGNIKMAASTAKNLFMHMDYLSNYNYEQLWYLILSDESLPMRAILEHYDIYSINEIFKHILEQLKHGSNTHEEHEKAHAHAISECKNMIICANAFCILTLCEDNVPDIKSMLYTIIEELEVSLIAHNTSNSQFYIAIYGVLYILLCKVGWRKELGKNRNEYSYGMLIRTLFSNVHSAIITTLESNPFVGAYLFTEFMTTQSSEGVLSIMDFLIRKGFAEINKTNHSDQVYKILNGVFSVLLRNISNGDASIDEALDFIREFKCTDKDLNDIITEVINGHSDLRMLEEINRRLDHNSERCTYKQVSLLHVGKLICIYLKTKLEATVDEKILKEGLYEILVYVHHNNNVLLVPDIIEWITANGLALYTHIRLKSKELIWDIKRLHIGLLLAQWCNDTSLLQDLFDDYKTIVEYAKRKRGSLQNQINVLYRIENILVYAQSEAYMKEVLTYVSESTAGYQGALKMAILKTCRHVFPYTIEVVDKLSIIAETVQWLKEPILKLVKSASWLLKEKEGHFVTECVQLLYKYTNYLLKTDIGALASSIMMPLNILRAAEYDRIRVFKQYKAEYKENQWTAAIMALLLCNKDKEKSRMYLIKWAKVIKQESQIAFNPRATKAIDEAIVAINIEFSSIKISYCIARVISIILFYLPCRID